MDEISSHPPIDDFALGGELPHPAVRPAGLRAELGMAAKHAAASGVGFCVDFVVLHLAMRAGLEPAWARVISLACAVNVTFVLNGTLVFCCLGWGRRLARQWAAYVGTNACGALCNYWGFVTLVSLHHPLVSRPTVALILACLGAWGINYAAARVMVFGRDLRRRTFGHRRGG